MKAEFPASSGNVILIRQLSYHPRFLIRRLLWLLFFAALAALDQPKANAAAIYGSTSDTDVRSDGFVINASGNFLQSGGSGSPALDRSSVFVFQLPDFGAVANPFNLARFRFNLANIDNAPPNADLYGLGRRAAPTVLAQDYYGETTTADPGNATFLQNNILGQGTALGQITTSSSGNPALNTYLNTQYAGGAGAGQYIFLRLSTDSPVGSVKRYNLTSADHGTAGPPDTRPQIIYNEPLPGIGRPFIWVRDAEKNDILSKIAGNPWATNVYNGMVSRVAADLGSHQSNRDSFLRQLPVDWTLAAAKFKTIPAYPESSVRYAAEAKFNDAVDCAVLYYLTGDVKYAKCAADILHNAVVTLLPVAPSTSVGNGGWIFQTDFLKEARVTATQLPIIYDFLYTWLQSNQVYDVQTAGMVDFDFTGAQNVFRTLYLLARDHGQKESNWSALMSTAMLNNLLALDSESERAAAVQVYLTTGSSRQASLGYDYRHYTRQGDIWPESLQYAAAVGNIRTTHMVLLERYDPALNLFDAYPNLPLSLPRISYLRYPNGQQVLFGDGTRNGTNGPFFIYELVYQHALARGRTDLTSFFGSLLNGAVAEGKYNRSTLNDYDSLGTQNDPLQLLWQAAVIPEPGVSPELPRTDRLPFAGIALQRNPAPANNTTYGLMCFVGGAGHVHSHASGMSMEIFGMGRVMGAKSGTESYGSAINENHYRLFAANNTVIVNGASRGEGAWNGFGINVVQTVAMEPQPFTAAVSPDFSFTCSTFADDRGTLAEGTQQRTMAIVRTSPTTGFYVDVFRSKSTVTNRTADTLDGPVTNQYHDYIYRNFGETAVDLRADGVNLPLVSQPDRFQNDIGDANAQPGWRYFTNTTVSYPTSASVRARFVATLSGTNHFMDMHMPAVASREYANVNSPAILDAPAPYDNKAAPTLVVRQIGEAWNKAFATVYEPHLANTGGTVRNVTRLLRGDVVVGMKIESTVAGNDLVHYVMSNPGSGETSTDASINLSFTGRFGIAADLGGGNINLYLGDGSAISYAGKSVATVGGSNSQAEVRFVPNQAPSVTANAPVNVLVSSNAAWVPTFASDRLDWDDTANWNPAVLPDETGSIASMNVDLTGDQIVNVNHPVTLGELIAGDNNGSQNTTLRNNTDGSMTFDQPDIAMAYLTRSAGGTGKVTLAGDLHITLADDLTVRPADDITVSIIELNGNISGVGKDLTKSGDHLTLRLGGDNSYSGTTALTGGVLRLDSATALGGGNLTLSGGGVMGLAAGNFTRALGTGAGQFQWTGNGGFAAFGAERQVIFSASSINWNVTHFIGGNRVLTLGHATADATLDWQQKISLAGSTRIVQVDNGSASIDAKMSGTVAGGSSGTSNVFNKSGTGTLAFTGQNTYWGNTIINAGTLMIGDGGTLGGVSQNSPSIIVEAGATLAVNRSNTVTQGTDPLKPAITGQGGFAQVGPGATVMTLPNTYTGPTTVTAGTLALGAAGVLPDTSAVSIDNAILDAATFSESAGTLEITGNATMNLGTGAAVAFSNSSSIDWSGGTLKLTGSFVSGTSLRFGTSADGLSSSQLALISINGSAVPLELDANGYVIQAASGYRSWQSIHAPVTGDDPNADEDGDTVTNGIEYLLGGTATTHDLDKLPEISNDGANMIFRFMRDQASIDGTAAVVIELGDNFVDWPTIYPVPASAAADNPGVTVVKDKPAGFDTVTLTLPMSGNTRRFLRIRLNPW